MEDKMRKYEKISHKIRRIDDELIPIKNLFELGREAQLRTDKIFIKFRNRESK
jgi:hypothetical protein